MKLISNLYIFIFLVALSLSVVPGTFGKGIAAESTEYSSSRNSKLLPFPFLAVVSFPNDRCETSYGVGACFSNKQCSRQGGFNTGVSCAYGYGICCYFSETCSGTNTGVTIKHNLTHIVTPPNLPQQCRYTIPRQKGVCQIRIDFLSFSLSDADPDGNCYRDTLIISGQDNFNHMTLCGTASPPDHLYLDYGQSDLVTLNMDLLDADAASMHDILVTMIKCDSPERAPDGCAQYYTDQRADVKSFNFAQQQLNNEMYMVCVKTFPGSDGIRWMKCTDNGVDNNFFITGMVGLNTTGSSGSSCVTDYVEFYGSPGGKYCGADFGTVETIAKPYQMWVNFDEAEFPLPSGPLNMTSGCPIGWSCADPEPCKDGGTCIPPPELIQITDVGNTGFCLRYVVG